MARALGRPFALVLVGLLGWGGLAWLARSMLATVPPTAGFDLGLLLEGGRRFASGASPYDPAMLAGTAPSAEDLFYSYPPPVAELAALVAGLPLGVALVGWALVATTGLAVVAWQIARRAGARDPRRATLAAVAVAPFVFPFAIAVLFGNLDAIYPLLYGAFLLAMLPGASDRAVVAGGVAVAVAAIAKLHPATLGVWLVVRAFAPGRSRDPADAPADAPAHEPANARLALLAAIGAGLVIVAASLLVGGIGPWVDYVAVVRAGAGADVVDPRNIAPVSLLGQLTALDGDTLRLVQVGVAIVALGVTAVAAWRVADPLASMTLAATASLVVLPVTWYHYPVALIPSAIALAVSRPDARPLVLLAGLCATVAVGWLPLTWVAVALIVVAALRRRGARA